MSFAGTQGMPTGVTFGWIHASHRTLDPKPYPELAEVALPFPRNGEIYDLQCEFWPTELVVSEGERLLLEVTAKDQKGSELFGCNDPVDRYLDLTPIL